jgi:transcriptional regulator with XRE-family HTH domain
VILTQREIARRVGVSRSLISAIKRGEVVRVRRSVARKLERLARCVETDIKQASRAVAPAYRFRRIPAPVTFYAERASRIDPRDPKRKRRIPSDTVTYYVPKKSRLQDIFDLIWNARKKVKAVKLIKVVPAGKPDSRGLVENRSRHTALNWESTFSDIFDSPEKFLVWILSQQEFGEIVQVQFAYGDK